MLPGTTIPSGRDPAEGARATGASGSTASGRRIDLNADLGESFGAYRLGADEALLAVVSSANVACGFHASDPRVMERTVALCKAHGVAVGAHPGFPDLVGFGRRSLAASPSEVRADVIYQVGALRAFCDAHGVPLQHVKPHGALYNQACRDPALAEAVAAAVAAVDRRLLLYALPGSELAKAGERAGLTVKREGFADRGYRQDGSLVPRGEPGAIVEDPEEAGRRAARMVCEGRVTTREGADIAVAVDTICLHGDNPEALAIARAVRAHLAAAGVTVAAFSAPTST